MEKHGYKVMEEIVEGMGVSGGEATGQKLEQL